MAGEKGSTASSMYCCAAALHRSKCAHEVQPCSCAACPCRAPKCRRCSSTGSSRRCHACNASPHDTHTHLSARCLSGAWMNPADASRSAVRGNRRFSGNSRKLASRASLDVLLGAPYEATAPSPSPESARPSDNAPPRSRSTHLTSRCVLGSLTMWEAPRMAPASTIASRDGTNLGTPARVGRRGRSRCIEDTGKATSSSSSKGERRKGERKG